LEAIEEAARLWWTRVEYGCCIREFPELDRSGAVNRSIIGTIIGILVVIILGYVVLHMIFHVI
jgi:hypothetical protein